MKLAFFDDFKLGIVVGDKIIDVSSVTKGSKALGPQEMIRTVIEKWSAYKSKPAPINAFMKSPSAVIGDRGAMVLPDMAASIFEGEAELAVVIGRRASHVKAADAMKYIFGYTNFIDGSARGVVPPTNVFYQMKSRDTFAPIGPYIV